MGSWQLTIVVLGSLIIYLAKMFRFAIVTTAFYLLSDQVSALLCWKCLMTMVKSKYHLK